MSSNDITGARLVSKANTKEYEDNYDRIFRKPPSCLDSAYEREAVIKGLCDKPVFSENKNERCVVYIDDEEVIND